MIPTRGYSDQRVAVLGLGRSGIAAAQSLIAGGAQVLCWDDTEAARDRAAAQGLPLIDLHKDAAWEDVVLLVLSPGIPHLYPQPHTIVQQAWKHGAVVDNDIGLFFRSYATEDWDQFDVMPQIIAVTGSNGKSTTTALLGHILKSVGRPVQVGGNIGRSALDLEPAIDGEIVVLELSSYQTEIARALAPDIAVFLNLSADHHDRHGGHGGYFAAKQRLFAQGGPDRAIIGVDQIEGAFLANQMRQESTSGDPVIKIATSQKLQNEGWSVFVRKGFLAEWRKGKQMASIDLRAFENLAGVHNHQNICAAYAACRSLGIAPRVIEKAIGSFSGLAHRSELIAEKDGVKFVNDSKATNAAAAATSLQTYKNVHWICGGQGKEGGIAELAPYFDHLRQAYLIGADAETFAAQLGDTPHQIAQTLEVAFAAAVKNAKAGDVILLAPAAASFDQFASFEARGEAFRALVEAL